MAETTHSQIAAPELRLSPWAVSGLLHGALVLGAMAIFFWDHREQAVSVPLEVIEVAKVSPTAVLMPKALPKPPVKPAPPAKKVFGVTRQALTSDASNVTAKAGNTVAKTPDAVKLRPEDEASLPIPADEFLITAMPKLVADRRVPYPPEAKKAGVQGAVVFDLLIDDQGRVRDAKLVQGPGFGLNEAAAQAVRELRFEPARVQDKVVAVRIRYAYRFVLEKN